MTLSADQIKRLRRVRRLTRWLDTAFRIPGIPVRFGLDGIIGLVPGLGDAVTAGVSVYLIREAARLGAPRPLLARMVANVGLDLVAGVVPVVGDLIDLAWKANVKNLSLLEDYLASQQRIATIELARRRPVRLDRKLTH
ncbi:MAG: DUF4112 domain-containing protein [Rhodopirellula sp.]|nr:DUF4112 domain-containing protein [Rhodopirellula sp.]